MTSDDEIKELKQRVAFLEQKHELLDQSYLKNIRYLSQKVADLQEENDKLAACDPELSPAEKLALHEQMISALQRLFWEDISYLTHRVSAVQEKVDKLSTPVPDSELEQRMASLEQRMASLEQMHLSLQQSYRHNIRYVSCHVGDLQVELDKLSELVPDFAAVEKLAHDAYIASSDAAQRALVDVAMAVPQAVDIPPEVSFNQLPTIREARALGIGHRRH
jgi:chromosome segregation ATPase